MVEFVLKVNGATKAAKNFSRLANQFKDRRVPNRAVAAQFFSWFEKNYDSDGRLVGGWAPLAEATVARKKKLGKERMLVITGTLRSHVLPFSDNSRAGIGTEIPYGEAHQLGKRVPQREFLPTQSEALKMGMQVYEFYIARAAKEANS